MKLIRCTKRLQKEMGLKKTDLHEAEPESSCLGSWHANLIYIDRRKCVLFVNDRTLFNFIAPELTRARIKELDVLFREYLQCVLAEEEIHASARKEIIAEYTELDYASSKNKSVLGSMNDLAFHYKFHILSEGGVGSCMVPSIIRKLNRMPMGAIEYRYPIEALRQMYESSR